MSTLGGKDQQSLLTINRLKVYYRQGGGLFRNPASVVRAIDDVDLQIPSGEICALVGEGGAGKTTLARAIVRLVPALEGDIYLHGDDILTLSEAAFRPYRKRIQLAFQDPAAALNPRMDAAAIIGECLTVHFPALGDEERQEKITGLLQLVGLEEEDGVLHPPDFPPAGLQRLSIARALAAEPELLILDEPTTRLDPIAAASLLDMLSAIQHISGLSYLITTPSLALGLHFADSVSVLYRGKVVEDGAAASIAGDPQHDYTKKLLAASPAVA